MSETRETIQVWLESFLLTYYTLWNDVTMRSQSKKSSSEPQTPQKRFLKAAIEKLWLSGFQRGTQGPLNEGQYDTRNLVQYLTKWGSHLRQFRGPYRDNVQAYF